MDRSRTLVSVTVGVIVVTAVVFGPLVSSVSLATEPEPAVVTDGSVTLRSATLPDTVTADAASYGASNVYLTVPPATVRLSRIRGAPKLVYSVELRDEDIKQSTIYFLDEGHGTTFRMTMPPLSLTETTLTRATYDATVVLAVRNSTGHRVLEQRNATVRVSV